MLKRLRFRTILPAIQLLLLASFGGVGLWQRISFLDRPLIEGQTLWNSTAAFHVWPWPLKFAIILNLPAVIAGSIFSYPLSSTTARNYEWIEMISWLICAAMLWYYIGNKLDMQIAGLRGSRTSVVVHLSLFTGLSLIGALVTPGYVWYGGLLWIVSAIWYSWKNRREPKETPT